MSQRFHKEFEGYCTYLQTDGQYMRPNIRTIDEVLKSLDYEANFWLQNVKGNEIASRSHVVEIHNANSAHIFLSIFYSMEEGREIYGKQWKASLHPDRVPILYGIKKHDLLKASDTWESESRDIEVLSRHLICEMRYGPSFSALEIMRTLFYKITPATV